MQQFYGNARIICWMIKPKDGLIPLDPFLTFPLKFYINHYYIQMDTLKSKNPFRKYKSFKLKLLNPDQVGGKIFLGMCPGGTKKNVHPLRGGGPDFFASHMTNIFLKRAQNTFFACFRGI